MYKMMRPKRSVVRDEFVIMPEGAKCKHCHRFLRCVQSSNMKKHLRYCQPDIYQSVQEADGNSTYNASAESQSAIAAINPNAKSFGSTRYPQNSSVSFTSEHISSFIESQLAGFQYAASGKDPSPSSPEEIPRPYESLANNNDDDEGSEGDEKSLKMLASLDIVEITDGVQSYQCLLSQVDPFFISKYFKIVPVTALKLCQNFITSKVSMDLKSFEPPLIAGRKYQIVTEEKVSNCKIVIDDESIEMNIKNFDKEIILGYMERPKGFCLVDGNGNVMDVENVEKVKLEERKVYYVVYEKQEEDIKASIKPCPMPIEYFAGVPTNRALSLLPPYLICISRAMHTLTFIGEKFDLRTATPQTLIGHTVAIHAAQVLSRLNEASKKIQFLTSNVASNALTSSMPKSSFSAAFKTSSKTEMTNGTSSGGKQQLPTSDIEQIVGSLERALTDMESFLFKLKLKFQVDISTIQHIEIALRIDNGARERKERMEEFNVAYGKDNLKEFEQVANLGLQLAPDNSQLDLQNVTEARKHFQFIFRLMEKLFQNSKMGKFSFNDLAELFNFSIEVLHNLYLHWLFILKFSEIRSCLPAASAEAFSTQFKKCSRFWYNVAQKTPLSTTLQPSTNSHALWKNYAEMILKSQYAIETFFFTKDT